LVSHFEGENSLRLSENTVLRRIFRPKREEDGLWRKLHNDEIHSLYSSSNIVLVTEHHAMKANWESGGVAPLIL
jgi:hypothetical protein